MEKYDVFVSYRRDGGDAVAGRITDKLLSKGYKVFFDVESMRSGDFNDQIYDAIDACTDMLVVLPPNGLDRCISADDWVRLEVAYAIKKNKNIVPVMLRNFSFPEKLPDDINYLRRLQGVVASMEFFDAVISRIESLLTCSRKEQLPASSELPKSKIKIPLLLKTPVTDTTYQMDFENFELISNYWWDFINSEEALPKSDEELGKLLLNKVKEAHKNKMYTLPYFINWYKSPDEEYVKVKDFKMWKDLYDRINDIYLVPKRYKDDNVNPQELMHEISELAQTCFYNDKTIFLQIYVAELIYQGKTLIRYYPRANGFSFMPVIDFCFKCFVSEQMIYYYDPFCLQKVKKFLCEVSAMIENCAKIYGVYEDTPQIVNTRVKLFLKYYQLISLYLDPEYKGKVIKKYLLINYKYLKKHNVVLTKENEELFEKLINVYSVL